MTTSPFSTAAFTVGTIAQIAMNDPTVSVVLAGMAGGAVRWHYKKEALWTGIGSVVVGGICAKFLGPVAVALFTGATGASITDQSGTMGAFLMGLGGIAVLGFILDIFEGRMIKPKDKEQKDDTSD